MWDTVRNGRILSFLERGFPLKKIIPVFLCVLMLFSISIPVFADGDPNLDGGGGGMDQGSGANSWTPGRDGVRITIVRSDDNLPASAPVDFTNGNTNDTQIHFGALSKINYRGGQAITPQKGGYYSIKPAQSMPTIVSASGGNNIPAIIQ